MCISWSPSDPKKSQCIDRCIQIHQISVNKQGYDIHIKFEVSLHFWPIWPIVRRARLGWNQFWTVSHSDFQGAATVSWDNYGTLVKVSWFKNVYFFIFSILPQNKQKISAPVCQGKNRNFQVRFLEELKTPKRHFEINWPLVLRLDHLQYPIALAMVKVA